MTPTKFNIKLYTDDCIINFGTFSAEVKDTIMTPDSDGYCHYEYNGDWYTFTEEDVEVVEAKAKILTKIIEYCEEGACASSYHRTILGVVCDSTDINDIINNDIKDNHYIKNGRGELWNGKEYGWELYSYEVTEVPIL